ncbi:hypothetical protein L1049_023395 [Liquidambar formosana]|uniref:Uncharacterized protein n=1 Tax=Liquidambar formosana TaxID=63359 RepID=A0AAP0RT98_LIQFO
MDASAVVSLMQSAMMEAHPLSSMIYDCKCLMERFEEIMEKKRRGMSSKNSSKPYLKRETGMVPLCLYTKIFGVDLQRSRALFPFNVISKHMTLI